MTVGVTTELVKQKLQGGIPSQDSNRDIRKEDIKAYIPAAINFVITKQYYINRDEGDRSLPSDFVSVLTLDVVNNETTLPRAVISLYRNQGIRTVESVSGNHTFIQQSLEQRGHNNKYYHTSFGDATLWTLVGKTIQFSNLSSLVDKVKVYVVNSGENLGDDDELPIPAGSETELIDIIVQFFLGQRELPDDTRPNNNPNI